MAMSGESGSSVIASGTMTSRNLTIDVHVTVRDRLDRLAWHYDYCLTELVERLAAAAEKHVEAKLSGEALEVYRAAGLYEA
jgi:hypothetical protein